MVAPDVEFSAEQASGQPVVLHAASVKDHNDVVARVAMATPLRRAILGAASVGDHNRAVAGIFSAYAKHVETFTGSQKKYLPRDPT